ncbi:hypothetical protein SBOR_1810 [Sclerotinia borealis F-4128]|uniref:Uncharacterized protein n=1 Tax=Sclerotinia borealis (strain F-4128) TaxID=1432307 RepID=W9CPQ6_SCLBF|nr:hypothetical protein SBOR_1810 [Sclerotinia borealis F-4128]
MSAEYDMWDKFIEAQLNLVLFLNSEADIIEEEQKKKQKEQDAQRLKASKLWFEEFMTKFEFAEEQSILHCTLPEDKKDKKDKSL